MAEGKDGSTTALCSLIGLGLHYFCKSWNSPPGESPFHPHESCSQPHLCPTRPLASASLTPRRRFHILSEAFQQVVPPLSFPTPQFSPPFCTRPLHTHPSTKASSSAVCRGHCLLLPTPFPVYLQGPSVFAMHLQDPLVFAMHLNTCRAFPNLKS